MVLLSGLPIWWEWVETVGGEERKGGGGEEYGLDCLYSGDGREDREGEGKVRG